MPTIGRKCHTEAEAEEPSPVGPIPCLGTNPGLIFDSIALYKGNIFYIFKIISILIFDI